MKYVISLILLTGCGTEMGRQVRIPDTCRVDTVCNAWDGKECVEMTIAVKDACDIRLVNLGTIKE